MSAAAALLTGMNVNAAGAVPVAGGELADPALGAATTFQLLIAELGAAQAPDLDLTPLMLDAGDLPIDTEGSQGSDEDLHGDDQSLIDALGALCAWQVPLLPAQPLPTAAVDVGDADGQAAEAGADTGVAVVAASVAGAAQPDGDDSVLADQRASAALRQPLAGSGVDAVTADRQIGMARPLELAAAAPQLAAVANAVMTEPGSPLRPKSATAVVETLLSQVDTTSNGSLLRMPVVSSSVTRTVAVPVHDPRWPEAVATQVRWAVADGVQSATLKMVPEHLGPVEMHIELKDNQVNVNFGASQADTRQALQDALPRLRDVLAGAGITLGQANVQQQSGRASQSAATGPRLQRDEAVEGVTTHTRMALGLVDLYA